MITDNIKTLILGIIGVLLLLSICVSVDYADTDINNTINSTIKTNSTDEVLLANTSIIEPNPKEDKVYRVKDYKLPLVTITAKPSVRSSYAYKWYTTTWVDYCPNCHHYNCLLINPKCVPERELTCKICDSDFCGVTGKEKYSWSRVYLRRA